MLVENVGLDVIIAWMCILTMEFDFQIGLFWSRYRVNESFYIFHFIFIFSCLVVKKSVPYC